MIQSLLTNDPKCKMKNKCYEKKIWYNNEYCNRRAVVAAFE